MHPEDHFTEEELIKINTFWEELKERRESLDEEAYQEWLLEQIEQMVEEA